MKATHGRLEHRTKTKWLWDDFWRHAAEPRKDEPQDAYIRGTGARSALNGICSATGYQPDVQFLKHLRRQREERD